MSTTGQVTTAFPLHYLDMGRGEALVFLNGLAGDHLYWMSQVRTFSSRFRCLAVDNRDAGRSPYATAPYTIADLAGDVIHLLDSFGLESAHLVGLSLGGMIALETALQFPARVRSLFLVGTLACTDDWFAGTLDAFCLIRRQVADTPAFFAALLPWLVSHRFFEVPGKADWLRALLKQNPYPQRLDGFFRQIDAIRGHNVLDRLPAVHCPVLAAVGEDDILAPPRYARQIAERVPGARLVILPAVGHAPPLEDPRAFNRVLTEFLGI